MPQYQICHSPRLSGEVKISTSKNAVLPILAAAMLTQDEVVIHETPRLTDVGHMVDILRLCGAEAQEEGSDTQVKCASVFSPGESALLRTMRASVLVMGPQLARTGE